MFKLVEQITNRTYFNELIFLFGFSALLLRFYGGHRLSGKTVNENTEKQFLDPKIYAKKGVNRDKNEFATK